MSPSSVPRAVTPRCLIFTLPNEQHLPPVGGGTPRRTRQLSAAGPGMTGCIEHKQQSQNGRKIVKYAEAPAGTTWNQCEY